MISSIALPREIRIGAGAIDQLPDVVIGLGSASTATHHRHASCPRGVRPNAWCARWWRPASTPITSTEPFPTRPPRRCESGLRAVRDHGADLLIGFGGGSPMDTAKALALLAVRGGTMRDYKAPLRNDAPGLPVVAVPTTAGSGSEATQFTIITDSESDEKMLCIGRAFLPVAAIVDYELTLSMPARLTADTGHRCAHPCGGGVRQPQEQPVLRRLLPACDRGDRRTPAPGVRRRLGSRRPVGDDAGGTACRHRLLELECGAGPWHEPADRCALPPRPWSVERDVVPRGDPVLAGLRPRDRYADCARALGCAAATDSDQRAAGLLVDELTRLSVELAVPTPQLSGIARRAVGRADPADGAAGDRIGFAGQQPADTVGGRDRKALRGDLQLIREVSGARSGNYHRLRATCERVAARPRRGRTDSHDVTRTEGDTWHGPLPRSCMPPTVTTPTATSHCGSCVPATRCRTWRSWRRDWPTDRSTATISRPVSRKTSTTWPGTGPIVAGNCPRPRISSTGGCGPGIWRAHSRTIPTIERYQLTRGATQAIAQVQAVRQNRTVATETVLELVMSRLSNIAVVDRPRPRRAHPRHRPKDRRIVQAS